MDIRLTIPLFAAMLLAAAASVPAAAQNGSLPRVLLIGDSITFGYTAAVTRLLDGRAEVHRVPVNASSTDFGLEHLEEWLGSEQWDVIHFNWGLHDLKHMKNGRIDLSGKRVSTREEYERNLETLVQRLRKTGAKLVWASTTPIPDGAAGRIRGQEIEFNRVAAKVMRMNRVAINDLFSAVFPRLPEYQTPANVHFNDAGYEFLGARAAAAIRAALDSR